MATTVKLEKELKDRVQVLADSRYRSAHWIMLEAIRNYIDREEARESFRQEALLSWTAYQETGRHLAAHETRDWLNKWGSSKEHTIPKCHV